jgi:hypothetical protein
MNAGGVKTLPSDAARYISAGDRRHTPAPALM